MKTKVLFWIPVFMIIGCTVHRPQPVPLPVNPPESYDEPGNAGPPLQRWWEAFGDKRLNRLMEEAFSGNLDLAQGVARLDAARAVLRSTSAARFPSLDSRGEWSRENTPGFFGNNTGRSYRLSLAAAFEVDLWRKEASRTRAAALDAAAAREDLKTLYLTLASNLADLYYLAAEQKEQLQLTDRTIAAFADTSLRVERRYREGLVPALDLDQARQNLAAVKAGRPLIEKTLRETEHAFALLLGRYPEEDITGVVALPEIPMGFPAGLPSKLLAHRPDVAAALARVKAADARTAAAIADRFPSINLAADYGNSSIAFSTGDIVGNFWKIIGNVAAPLLDGGRRRAAVKRNRALFRESLARYQQTVLTAFREVEDALVRNRTTEERIAGLQEKVAASRATLRLSLDRYLAGLSDYLPVLTAQAASFDSQSELLSARRQLISDRITLARSLGGEWMEKEMKDQKTKNTNTTKDNPHASTR
ncbi:MAG: efflux transporter outer membrane subunit [Deltaproteobacteria bacterium]|nr:efflux transporter outer membrane subunit [Deltaproteobacteria bacterium]